jgi:hypothetical protein
MGVVRGLGYASDPLASLYELVRRTFTTKIAQAPNLYFYQKIRELIAN